MSKTRKKSRSLRLVGVIILSLLALLAIVSLFLRKPAAERRRLRAETHLAHGRYQQALGVYQEMLQKDANHGLAHLGIVRSHLALKQFDEAMRDLDAGEKDGVDPVVAAFRRADILAERAKWKLASVGSAAVDAKFCDALLKDDLNPAIELVEKNAPKSEQPAAMFATLGNLHNRVADLLLRKRKLLQNEARQAAHMNHYDLATSLQQQAAQILPEVATAERHALMAYDHALLLDPKNQAARLQMARHALGTYQPRPDVVRHFLKPITDQAQPHPEARQMMARAERLAGNPQAALDQIKMLEAPGTFLPRAAAYEKVLALMMLSKNAEALTAAEQWLQTDPENDEAAFLLGKLLLVENRINESVTRLQNVSSRANRPWPMLRAELGRALEKQGSAGQAIRAYQETLKDLERFEPVNAEMQNAAADARYEAGAGLARLMVGDHPDEAWRYAKEAVRAFPERADGMEAARKAADAANVTWTDLEGVLLIHIGAVSLNQGTDAGIALCRKEMETAGETRRLRAMLGQLLAHQGSFTEAKAEYEALHTQYPQEIGLMTELGRLSLQQRDYAGAESWYEKALQANPKDRNALSGFVSALAAAGRSDDVEATLRRMGEKVDATHVRLMLINYYLQQGKVAEAIPVAESQARLLPTDAAAATLLADLYWRGGKIQEARESYARALALNPAFEPAYRRILLELADRKNDEAVRLCREALDRFPDSTAIRLNLAAALCTLEACDEALAALKAIPEKGNVSAAELDLPELLTAVAHAARGDISAAAEANSMVASSSLGLGDERRRLLNSIASLTGSDRAAAAAALMKMLIFSEERLRDPALAAAEDLSKLIPSDNLIAFWRCQMLLQDGKLAEAAEEAQALVAANPQLPRARLLLANICRRQGKNAEAIEAILPILGSVPAVEAAPVQVILGGLYQEMGEDDKALDAYLAATASPRIAPRAYNNAAYLLATRKNDLDSALAYAQKAMGSRSAAPEVLDTAGWIYCLRNEHDKAIEMLEGARQGLRNQPSVRYHLGMAYLGAGRKAEAKSELLDALSLSEDFPEAAKAAEALKKL